MKTTEAIGGTVTKAEPEGPLVNESMENKIAKEAGKVEFDEEGARNRAEITALKFELEKKTGKANALESKVLQMENKLGRSGLSDESREFRLFMEIVNGFVMRGILDPTALAAAIKSNPANRTPEFTLLTHAAGLAAVANKAARDKGF